MLTGKQPYRRLGKLEALRGAAAIYVFVHHYVHGNEELAYLAPFFILGQLALMVFFVLSGFVIYYASVYRDPDIKFGTYLKRRVVRIYPAFIAILILTYLLRSLTTGQWLDFHVWEAFGNILQFQDKHPYSWFDPYWQNAPLWSLAYEWWFYMIFFAFHRLTRHLQHLQQYMVIGMSVLGFATFWVFPNQFSLYFSYFLLWWAGVEVAREWTVSGTVTFKGQWKSILSVLGMTALWLLPAFLHWNAGNKVVLAEFPFVQPRHFFTVALVLCFAVIWKRTNWFAFRWIAGQWEWVGSISYAIYIFHYPVIYLAAHTRPTGSVYLDFIWVAIVIFGVSWLIEQPYQKFMNKMFRPRKQVK